MYSIYCDESWTPNRKAVKCPYFVFYGVMVQSEHSDELLETIDAFKRRRGLYNGSHPIEMKWDKVEKEFREAKKSGRTSRYPEYIDILFQALKNHWISCGTLFLPLAEYKRVEKDFLLKGPSGFHDFFFMLYFMLLHHCFIKKQVKQNPCEIWIDNRNMGGIGRTYNLDDLRTSLNSRLYREYIPKVQLPLSFLDKKELVETIGFTNLAESDQEPLIQLADIGAGCYRYILENEIQPPGDVNQLSFIDLVKSEKLAMQSSGREELANYFYAKLRSIKGYETINLMKQSFHYRFNIFPFMFTKQG